MEIALLVLGIVLLIGGIFTSMVPALPGPIVGYIGMVLVFLSRPDHPFSGMVLLYFGIATAVVTIVENFLPVLSAKYAGASRRAVRGALIGTLLGLVLFPPFGALIGAFVGALAGELSEDGDLVRAANASIGIFVGTIAALALRAIFSLSMLVYVLIRLV